VIGNGLEADADFHLCGALGQAGFGELFIPLFDFVLRAEADIGELLGEVLSEEVEDLLRLGGVCCVFYVGVDVLGILAEDEDG